MPMRSLRWVTLLLLGALLLLQWSLWFGARSLPEVRRLQAQLQTQAAANEAARQHNQQLEDEAADLRTGMQAVQDRARREMGMIAPDEVFVQVLPASSPLPPAPPPAAPSRH
jgi:cell division protein FtsB